MEPDPGLTESTTPPARRDEAWDTVAEADRVASGEEPGVAPSPDETTGEEAELATPPGPVEVEDARRRAQDRTLLGFTAMMVGFALDWIPYVDYVGSLILLVGVALLWTGRRAFSRRHESNVLLGGACVVLAFAIGFLTGLWFVYSILGASGSAGSVANQLGSDLGVVFLVGILTATLSGLGYLLLPYALADRTAQLLLSAALALTVLIALLAYAIYYPQIVIAVGDSTAGGTFNSGPLQSLDAQLGLFEALQIGPYALFLVAYYRTRSQVRNVRVARGPGPVDGPYGRT